jgi:hypothetical protein
MACELQDLFLLLGSSQRAQYVCVVLLIHSFSNDVHLAQAVALAFKCALSAKYDANANIDLNTFLGPTQSMSFLSMLHPHF